MSTKTGDTKSEVLSDAAEAYKSAANYVDPESEYGGGGIPMLRFRVLKDILEQELSGYYGEEGQGEYLLESQIIETLEDSASRYGRYVCKLADPEVNPPKKQRKEKAQEIRQISAMLDPEEEN